MHRAYPAPECLKAQADNICGAGAIHFKNFIFIFNLHCMHGCATLFNTCKVWCLHSQYVLAPYQTPADLCSLPAMPKPKRAPQRWARSEARRMAGNTLALGKHPAQNMPNISKYPEISWDILKRCFFLSAMTCYEFINALQSGDSQSPRFRIASMAVDISTS